jgi:hypothetical protein
LAANRVSEAHAESFMFGGFKSLNCTPIPDEFFDVLAVELSEAELRVLLYIMRRTFGFKKHADAISLSQLTSGIRRRDGTVLDQGTGLSKPSVLKAVSGLQDKGIISIEKNFGSDGRNEVNVYKLRFADADAPVSPITGQISYQPECSTSEYFSSEYNLPDPRTLSARPATATGRGQLPSGATGNSKPSLPQGVNVINRDGKTNLPAVVKSFNRDGKNTLPQGVKTVNRQHDSHEQKISLTTTTLLCADGSLALQPIFSTEPEYEPVEVEVDGDQLYIGFRKLVIALTELGLSEQLANDYAYAYPEDYLWEKIELTKRQLGGSRHQPAIRNVVGYLRRAIAEDYQPPKTRQKPVSGFPAASYPATASAPSGTYTAPLPPTRHGFRRPPTEEGSSFSPVEVPETVSNGAVRVGDENFSAPPDAAIIWQLVLDDLAGRFQLDSTSLSLLTGAHLEFTCHHTDNLPGIIWLASPWQERQLSILARQQIRLALRQRAGPGYTFEFRARDDY